MNQGLSTNYSLKAHIERIFGNKLFLIIKDYPSLKTWKKTILLLINSYKKAVEQSIQVAPSSFYNEINKVYEHYNSILQKSKNEEELFSNVIAFQSEFIFTLLGSIVQYEERTLNSSWDLSVYRETQIVQTKAQVYKQIQNMVNSKFTALQIEEMATEKRCLNSKENFYLWIFNNKMNGKI